MMAGASHYLSHMLTVVNAQCSRKLNILAFLLYYCHSNCSSIHLLNHDVSNLMYFSWLHISEQLTQLESSVPPCVNCSEIYNSLCIKSYPCHLNIMRHTILHSVSVDQQHNIWTCWTTQLLKK